MHDEREWEVKTEQKVVYAVFATVCSNVRLIAIPCLANRKHRMRSTFAHKLNYKPNNVLQSNVSRLPVCCAFYTIDPIRASFMNQKFYTYIRTRY